MMLLHTAVVVAATSFSALAFWGIVVVDARRQQQRLVQDVLSGTVKIFSAGGVVYHEAEALEGSPFIAAKPIHVAENDVARYVILDPQSLSRAISLQTLGLEAADGQSGNVSEGEGQHGASSPSDEGRQAI